MKYILTIIIACFYSLTLCAQGNRTIYKSNETEGSDQPAEGDWGDVDYDEDVDVSRIDNAIYINDVYVMRGMQTSISVNMKNLVSPTGFQFDLTLPKGLEIAKDANGKYLINLSTKRTTSQNTDLFEYSQLNENTIRVICNSSTNKVFTGNDGEVATIQLISDPTVLCGNYSLALKNVEVAEANGTPHPVYGKINSNVRVCLKGDVNNDGDVDVADVTELVRYVINDWNNPYINVVGDSDGDGTVDVMDITLLVRAILNNGKW